MTLILLFLLRGQIRPARLASGAFVVAPGPAQTLLSLQISQRMEQNRSLLSKRAFPLIHTHTVMRCHPYLFVLCRFVCSLNLGSRIQNHQSQ